MKFLTPFFAAALALTAQTAPVPAVPQELLGKAVAPAPAPRRGEAQAAQPQAAVAPTVVSDGYELAVSADSPITVAPGQFYLLPQSKLDFTGINHARIALQPVNSQDITGLRIAASWAAAGTYFNVTDISSGDGNSGSYSLYAPTYGPGLKVVLYNGSDTAMQIRQLSVYAAK